VTGDVNAAALEDLVRLCTELGKLRHADDRGADAAAGGAPGAPSPNTTQAWDALEQAIIGKAVDLLSGPGGLASFVRRRQLGARLGGPSLPLDIGYSETIPAGIRSAVMLRDQHCQWAGRCDQPAAACEVHHVRHKADGGPTSVKTSDAVNLSSCLAGFPGCVGEGGGFVVVLAGGQAVVQAAEHAAEQVALGGGVTVAGVAAAVVVGAGAG
jgi:hypothetical protein